MILKFYNRDFSEKPVQPGLDFVIERYGWDVNGGPKQASVSATGDRDALWELVNHMREPVEIIADNGECVWWGYLAQLEISWGAISYGVDVEQMSNTVAVAYTSGNERFTTQWSADPDSVAEYGTKKLLLSHSDITEADALQERDTYLAGARFPIPILAFQDGSTGEARITLRGWFGSLEWEYYLNQTGQESYEVTGDGGREVGEDDRPILAMSFQIGAATGWTATTLWLHIWRQGTHTPGDNLNVSIRANSSGKPGTVLASASIAGSAVPTNAEWVPFTLSAPVALTPGTTYFIYAARSVSIDPAGYYMLDTNRMNGYPRGYLIIYNTNLHAWVNAAGKGDLLFRLEGMIDTTSQIAAILASCGQFFAGAMVETTTGINTTPYRIGDSTGLYELNELLDTGTANNRRLLAEVTRARYARVYEEPGKPAVPYGLGDAGQLYFPGTRNLVPAELCPVGIWARLVDVIPATIDLSVIADPSTFFIEAAEYDALVGRYRITRTRNQASPYSIGGITQG